MKRLHLIILYTLIFTAAVAQRDTVMTTQLREISVVAVKQQAETDLSAVTVVGSEQLDRLNIVTMKGVSEIAPNFYIPEYGSRMTSSIYVRGLGARMDQPVVGLNVDNVPFLNKDNYDFDLFDIERIEVFRGAQSILNGRNTMGGQVNIYTLSPWRYRGWRSMAEYGRANSIKAGAGWYGRLSDVLATSVTGYYTRSDGFFRNEHTGARLDKEQQGAVRWKLSWHPSTRLSVMNVASASVTRQGGYPYQSIESGRIAYDDTCFYRRTSIADGLTIGWSSKRVTVNSVTSLQYIDDNMTLDQDFTPLPYFTLTQARREWALTEDLYARGRRGIYHWLGGVFAFYKHTDMDAPVTFKDRGVAQLIEDHANSHAGSYPISWDAREFVLGSSFLSLTRGIALYHQSTVELGGWTFEGGIRWDIEHPTLIYHSDLSTGYTVLHRLPDGSTEVYSKNPVEIHDGGHLRQTFNEVLPKLTIGYTFSGGTRLYASMAKGYKAGGYNTQMFSDVLQQRLMEELGLTRQYDVEDVVTYKPEKSWTYEVGANATVAGGRLSLDADLFFIRCTDQQLTVFPAGLTTGRIMTNAGRTRSFGAELSVCYRPTSAVTLRASYGMTNATFRHYNNGIADFRGKRVPYAPANTLFVSADYELPFSMLGAVPSVNINCRGIGKIYWDEANTVEQPFYATAGASLALTGDRWSVRVWGENLTNTKYSTFYFVSMQRAFLQQGRPWSVGATVRFNI